MTNNNSCDSSFNIFEGKEWTILDISHVSFEIFIGLIAIIGNLLVIIVFIREKRLRREINFYIISLALGDLGVGLVSVPIYVVNVEFKNKCAYSSVHHCGKLMMFINYVTPKNKIFRLSHKIL